MTSSDFRGPRRLAAANGSRFAGGVKLHESEVGVSFGEMLCAQPIRMLWESY